MPRFAAETKETLRRTLLRARTGRAPLEAALEQLRLSYDAAVRTNAVASVALDPLGDPGLLADGPSLPRP